MKRYEPKRWQATAKERKDVAELNLANPEPPKQTFDKSPFILKDDTRAKCVSISSAGRIRVAMGSFTCHQGKGVVLRGCKR